MAGDIPEFTDSNFESDVMRSETPVVVDFWADWCAPCKALAPTIEALSVELSGTITVGKMDITVNPETPAKFGVTSIPTLLLFQGGAVVGSVVGNRTGDELKAEFSKAFGASA